MKYEIYNDLPFTYNYDAMINALVNKNTEIGHAMWNRGVGKNVQVMRLQKLLLNYHLSLYVFHRIVEFDKEQNYLKSILYPLLLDAVLTAQRESSNMRMREVYTLIYCALFRSSFSDARMDSALSPEKLKTDARMLADLILYAVDNPPDQIELPQVVVVLNMELAEKNVSLTSLKNSFIQEKDYKHMRKILKGKQESCGDMQILMFSAVLETLPSSVYERAVSVRL